MQMILQQPFAFHFLQNARDRPAVWYNICLRPVTIFSGHIARFFLPYTCDFSTFQSSLHPPPSALDVVSLRILGPFPCRQAVVQNFEK